MSRIFASLATVAVVLMLAAIAFGFAIGLRIGAYNELFSQRVEAERMLAEHAVAGQEKIVQRLQEEVDEIDPVFRRGVQRATWHMLTGILAGIVAVLVNSISVTYFIGTSRWCKEVTDTYELNPELADRSAQLKRKSFPWALLGIVTIIVIVALGGASDPGTGMQGTANWVVPHFLFSICGVAVVAWSFVQQAAYIRRNSELVEQILEEVRRIRTQRGLDVEASEGQGG